MRNACSQPWSYHKPWQNNVFMYRFDTDRVEKFIRLGSLVVAWDSENNFRRLTRAISIVTFKHDKSKGSALQGWRMVYNKDSWTAAFGEFNAECMKEPSTVNMEAEDKCWNEDPLWYSRYYPCNKSRKPLVDKPCNGKRIAKILRERLYGSRRIGIPKIRMDRFIRDIKIP